MKMPYCSKCTIGEDDGPSHSVTSRQRVPRAVVGVGWLVLARVLLNIPVPAIAWPLTIIAAWFGISHLIASWTAYPDCPELGAVASLVSQRYIRTRCGPWERLDKCWSREADGWWKIVTEGCGLTSRCCQPLTASNRRLKFDKRG